ncbi:Protein strawberry notch homolog 2,Protein FORGETTER 1,Protein strawberry notch,Protein strawberry notch homolog 1 [Lepeophtheirus salmonis]|uniref:Protein strawberry notch homolog 2,Protein FORGETTER 1,Protein strawberry notch,Protein strawberry notch homolog 1 n=1 Tax=Lepeophtheirus salmonis TaxID=72036 RepID=A0A7R8CLD8_LEPSM|nr:Protein strawberry notch homolog 2,Protein FORGETTER 1,Protein strawberry notch,Protein strawberry notch homolog 1 [Lepeophtheirus salmonis]CAF2822632.1 Protein strawberry notch homolog 2,Protein FORGETTER 1,Protein strawberry notch,Protein strawberry notch homolog 1 [Lepeophtheirus salmonis]
MGSRDEFDDTDEEEDVHKKEETPPEMEEEEEEDDSDFEDPDELEVPGGGMSLKTIQKKIGGPSTSKEKSLLKAKDNQDDDLEVVGIVGAKKSTSNMSRGLGGFDFSSPFMSPSLMAAQDPYYNLSSSSLLQKSMGNGNLSRMIGGMPNPFAMNGSMNVGPLPNPFRALRQNQINNLWMNNVPNPFKADSNAEDEEVAAEDEEDMGVIETYSNYKPPKLKIGRNHPDPVVETASLASVEPPEVWYEVSIPASTIDEGKLSALQLESITYTSQQHAQFLPNGDRAGFLIGDGAGVGKGRTIAGIIFENYCKGRRRSIWVSVSNDLKYDAERDLADIGASDIEVNFLSKMKYAKINSSINNNIKKGVIFSTYSALIGESQGTGKYKTRLKQILNWCGEDFDGLIVFDECHKAKNLCPSGAGKPTKTGQTVLELQNKLPKARIVYASATGASEPKHMAYMVRLGIWGPGSPFRDFQEFLSSVEKRGVGAMEIVAMDMKLRGAYIARQLSFQGVTFKVEEIELSESMRRIYNKSVDIWVDLFHKFHEAAELVDADKKMRKKLCGVDHVVKIAEDVIKMGKCVVIGLQSTGEARTIEAIEREEELTDFVSTAKGVLLSLVEKHFPARDKEKLNRILSYTKQKTILDDLGIKVDKNSSSIKEEDSINEDDDDKGSDFEAGSEDEDEDEEDYDDDESEEDFNPFGGSDNEDDDPWARRGKSKNDKKKKKKKAKDPITSDPFYAKAQKMMMEQNKNGSIKPKETLLPPKLETPHSSQPSAENIEKACQMRDEMLQKIEKLGKILPANTLDQLIDELGGPENVSEMTGRKGRVVQAQNGDVRYESRSEFDVPLETLNITEKNRFMRGEKDVAIISEAASSGISLQADRRVKNRKRRVHMTLELPWSADRAIQQFGPGEHRFASIVAKRLESLGALTHGDRRATATDTRDLSRFNIDNKYGRTALEATFKAIMGYESPIVKPPTDYPGDFFKDIANGLIGVGLITQNAIISQAKRTGKYDQGILDVGLTEEDRVELVKTHTFKRKHATGVTKIELHVLHVERGLSWEASQEKWSELVGADEGYWVSHQVRNNKKTAILAVALDNKKGKENKKEKMFVLYRPNTGQQVKNESLSERQLKYALTLTGIHCEVGLRRKTYNVLAGSVLTVWTQVETVLTHDGNRKGIGSKMQISFSSFLGGKKKLENGKRIVGTLIPNSAMTSILRVMEADSEESEETIY